MTLKPDAAAIVARRQRELGIGVSEAINDLVRAGAAPPPSSDVPLSDLPTAALGVRIDVTSVADALEALED